MVPVAKSIPDMFLATSLSAQETGVVSRNEVTSPTGLDPHPNDFDFTDSPTSPVPAYLHDRDWHTSTEKLNDLKFTQSANSLTNSTASLEKDGFSSDEREEHRRTVRYLLTLRILAVSRIALRVFAVAISLAAFVLITVTVILFVKFTKHHSLGELNTEYAGAGNDTVHLTPATFFASISGVFLVLSVIVNVLCCVIPSVRKITPLSNLIFGLISVAGLAGWLGSCLALEHNKHTKTNFWYAVCEVGELYHDANNKGLPSSGKQFVKFCNNTTNSWNLAVLQVVLEGLTFFNVLIAWLMIKTGAFRH